MTVRTRRFGTDAAMGIDRIPPNRELAGEEPTVRSVGQSMIKSEFGTRRDEVHLLRRKSMPAVRADDFVEQPHSVGCGFHHRAALKLRKFRRCRGTGGGSIVGGMSGSVKASEVACDHVGLTLPRRIWSRPDNDGQQVVRALR